MERELRNPPDPLNTSAARFELATRFVANSCEICFQHSRASMGDDMRRAVLVPIIASLVATCASRAQEPRDFSELATQIVHLPGTPYSVVFNSPELQIGEPRDMQSLSVAIASWVSADFGLPTMRHPPHIAYASATDIVSFQHQLITRAETVEKTPSLYVPRLQTIFLPEGWNGSSPLDMSLFVRAIANHLQSEFENGYRCMPNGERFGASVQRRWLAVLAVDYRVNARELSSATSHPKCVSYQISVD